AFLVLYGLAAWQAFDATGEFGTATSTAGVDTRVVVGATLAGLAMFAILFLGTILAVFLTLGAVRGDAAVCVPYVIAIALATFLLTDALGGWWPDRVIAPLAALGLGVAILAAIS